MRIEGDLAETVASRVSRSAIRAFMYATTSLSIQADVLSDSFTCLGNRAQTDQEVIVDCRNPTRAQKVTKTSGAVVAAW